MPQWVCRTCHRPFPTQVGLSVHFSTKCGSAASIKRIPPPSRHPSQTSPLDNAPSSPRYNDDIGEFGGGGEEESMQTGDQEAAPRFPAVYYGPDRPSTAAPKAAPLDPNPFHPFANFSEYSLAQIVLEHGLSDAVLQKLLWRDELAGNPTFSSVDDFHETLESLPNDLPFTPYTIKPVWPTDWTQDRIDRLPPELKLPQQFAARNIVDVAKHLAGSPDFAKDVNFRHRLVVNKFGQQVLEETCDGARWSELERALRDHEHLLYGIFASDKVGLTAAMNRKTGYPGYFSIGNLSATDRLEIRRESTIKVAEFPVFDHVSKEVAHSHKKEFLLYKESIMRACFGELFRPILETPAFDTNCGDGRRRTCRLIIAALLADYPEQCLLAAVLGNRCPVCKTPHGQLDRLFSYRDPEESHKARFESSAKVAKEKGYRFFTSSAFDNIPLHDVSRSITPDLLHQLLKPLKDYIIDWTKLELEDLDEEDHGTRAQEFELRLKLQFPFAGLKHFSNGSDVKGPWGGNDSRAAGKILLGCIDGLGLPLATFNAIHAYLDIIILTRLPRQTDSLPNDDSSLDTPTPPLKATLALLDDATTSWKKAIEEGAFSRARPEGFDNLKRMHSVLHFAQGIRMFGPPVSLSTDGPERRHQLDEKDPYSRTSKHHATEQILKRNGISLGMHEVNMRVGRSGEKTLRERVMELRSMEKTQRGKAFAPAPSTIGYRMPKPRKANAAAPHEQLPPFDLPPTTSSLDDSLLTFLQHSENSQLAQIACRTSRITLENVRDLLVRTSISLTIHYALSDVTFSPIASPSYTSTILRSNPTWMLNDDTTRTRSSEPVSRFDFAVIRYTSSGTTVLRVGRVRKLFTLMDSGRNPVAELAYIEWMKRDKRFERSLDERTELPIYRKEKTAEGVQKTSIIQVSEILRPVHLQPRLHYPTSLQITRATVYETVETFYLNIRIDHDFWSWFQLYKEHFNR